MCLINMCASMCVRSRNHDIHRIPLACELHPVRHTWDLAQGPDPSLSVVWMGEPTSYATTSTAPQPDLSAGAQRGGNSQICNRTSRRVARGLLRDVAPTDCYISYSRGRGSCACHGEIRSGQVTPLSFMDGGHCAHSSTQSFCTQQDSQTAAYSRIVHTVACALSCHGINAIMVAP